MILAVLFVILNMVAATQYAVTKLGYEFTIVHPCDSGTRLIGSDNSTDNIRVLRVAGSNTTNVRLKLALGDKYSTNMVRTFTAAFGIVNENNFSLNITHINVSSSNHTYMKIYLHGNRTADASNSTLDNSSVFMWNNNTLVNASNTTAWVLRAGNDNSTNMCYNVSNSSNCTISTPWDETAHVRFSTNNSLAASNVSDFVWVQITMDIPEAVETIGTHTGTIWINFEYENS